MSRPEPIHDHAVEHLRVIRDAMERAGTFTAVPGWGTVVIGATAVVASVAAAGVVDASSWLRLWIVEGFAASALAIGAIVLKARRLGLPLTSALARKFALAFLPSLAAGAILSTSLAMHGLGALLPGTWLLLYGAAVVAAGSMSVRLVPLMGVAFMALGVAALAAAPKGPNLFMAAGFGVLHLLFGLFIARKHGG